MLDRNIFESIEKRMHDVRNEERDLTICEKDREYLYHRVLELVNGSILEILSVPNPILIEG